MKVEFVGGPLDGITDEVSEGIVTIDMLVPVYPMSDMVGEPDTGCLAAAVCKHRVRYQVERVYAMQHPAPVQKAVFKGYVSE